MLDWVAVGCGCWMGTGSWAELLSLMSFCFLTYEPGIIKYDSQSSIHPRSPMKFPFSFTFFTEDKVNYSQHPRLPFWLSLSSNAESLEHIPRVLPLEGPWLTCAPAADFRWNWSHPWSLCLYSAATGLPLEAESVWSGYHKKRNYVHWGLAKTSHSMDLLIVPLVSRLFFLAEKRKRNDRAGKSTSPPKLNNDHQWQLRLQGTDHCGNLDLMDQNAML